MPAAFATLLGSAGAESWLGIGHLHGAAGDSASALDLGGVPCQFRQYE